ncbi:NMDA receptor-regulated protein 1-domain-containing protein [Phycomyces nitens]|nr:NMDA receptor-regulated protein 1-domain-containing protein [Phycomyces nitens]
MSQEEIALECYEHLAKAMERYENENYFGGLMVINSLLDKYPKQADALSLKGLLMWNLGYKTEGYTFGKQSLEYDPTSYSSWRWYGHMLTKDSKVEESLEYYKKAAELSEFKDPEAVNEYACVQTHLRMYSEALETRKQYIYQLYDEPSFWIGMGVLCDLIDQPDIAINVFNTYCNTMMETSLEYDRSEVLLFYNSLVEKQERYQDALDHLENYEIMIKDKRSWKEKHAYFLEKTGKSELAESGYRQLINENPHDSRYINSLLTVKGYTKDKRRAQAQELLSILKKEHPRSNTIADIYLNYTSPNEFILEIKEIIQNSLRKGIPSLFARLKKYYKTDQRTIEEIILDFVHNLKTSKTFDGNKDSREPPTALLWALYYMAQHYDFLGNREKALDYIQQAIDHTPTVVELYMVQARILKHQGDLETAARVMNRARKLDLQDRFVNSKCAKYMLRAGYITKAKELFKMFLGKRTNTRKNLSDMQCQWFILEEGLAYLKKENYAKAIARFLTIDSFYNDFKDNEFGIHSYCLHKTTLRTYVELLKWEDTIRKHPYYIKAAKGAIQAYLALEAAQKLDATESGSSRKTLSVVQDEQDDEEGESLDTEYKETKTPLEDALVFLQPLQRMAPNLVETHALTFEVYLRKEQWHLARKCLIAIAKIDKSHPSFSNCKEMFERTVLSKSIEDDLLLKKLMNLDLLDVSTI